MLHVIIGPPCAGKSTYVDENRENGDVVVDFDKLCKALGSDDEHAAPEHIKQAGFKARSAVIKYLTDNTDANGWVIHSSPAEWQLDAYKDADVVVIDPGIDECLRRAEERPPGTVDVIKEWYESAENGAFSFLEKGNSMAKYKAASDAATVDGGRVVGYASTFDREPDAYGDVIAKGAFEKSLAAWREKMEQGIYIPLLYGHNTEDPKYNIGRVVEFGEDEKGLLIEAEFDADNETAQYVRKLAQEGRLYQFSFAFDVRDWGEVTLDDGTKANELRELEIYEVSLVQIPANQHAQVVEVKCADCQKSGRRNSKADELSLREILDKVDDIADDLVDIQTIVNGLIEAETSAEPEANTEEQEANVDEPKDYSALLDEANRILERKGK